MDELLHFLLLFEVPGRDFIKKWSGGERTEGGAITTPYPVYAEDVQEFHRLASQPCWSDHGYRAEEARKMLEDDEFIAHATVDNIKTMLTYCVRGERFSDGHWARMLESGRVVAVLKRLEVLRKTMV